MLLKELITPLKVGKIQGSLNIDIRGVAYDSREVKSGELFVAIPGLTRDGAEFIPQAIQKGARAIVTHKNVKLPSSMANIVVEDPRTALAILANKFYDHPSRKLKVMGITGTNGKTTTAYFLEAILKRAGFKVGLISTIEARMDGKTIPLKLTTPEAPDLQGLLALMVEEQVTHVVMEVSSHALALDRVWGCEFDMAIFTNLTHDHLDFHKTMKDYLEAKLKLFQMLDKNSKDPGLGIINADEPSRKEIIASTGEKILTYGINGISDFSAEEINISLELMSFKLSTAQEAIQIETPLIGVPNVYNILAATAGAKGLGMDLQIIKKAIQNIKSIPGRFERIKCEQKFPVIVDFAHSPDSLQKLMETVRPLTPGRIILVFGCPGDRDKLKRPMMGEIAARLADFSIITTDDSHSEEPKKIIEDIEAGMKALDHDYAKIIDRREAIKQAIRMAKDEDIVLIAGRGHEKYQDFNGVKVEIDDREVVKKELEERLLI